MSYADKDEDVLRLDRYWDTTHPHRRPCPKNGFRHRYRDDAPKLRALVVVYSGVLQAVYHIGYDFEWLIDENGEDLSEYLGGDESDLPNGVYVWEGVVVSIGWYDYWSGGVEYDPYLEGEFRPATREEWNDHVKGNYPWDTGLWFSDEPDIRTDSSDEEIDDPPLDTTKNIQFISDQHLPGVTDELDEYHLVF